MSHQEGPWLARNNPETTPITVKPGTVSSVAEHFSWVALPCCSLPGCLFPISFCCFIGTCVSLGSSLLSVRQEPTLKVLERIPLPATERGAHIVTLHGAASKQASHVLLVKRQRKSLLPRISTFWSREMYPEELYADRRQCICLFCIGLIRRLTVGGQVQTKKHQTQPC